MPIIIPYAAIRAASNVIKAAVIIDNGTIYGIGDANIYASPDGYVGTCKHDDAKLFGKPVYLYIHNKKLDEYTGSVEIHVTDISEEERVVEMTGHDFSGNPIFNLIGIRYANHMEKLRLKIAKEIIAKTNKPRQSGLFHGQQPMQTVTVNFETLKELTGFNTPSEIAASLSAQGIKFFRGKYGRPWTTLDAINTALGIINRLQQTEELSIRVR